MLKMLLTALSNSKGLRCWVIISNIPGDMGGSGEEHAFWTGPLIIEDNEEKKKSESVHTIMQHREETNYKIKSCCERN